MSSLQKAQTAIDLSKDKTMIFGKEISPPHPVHFRKLY